MFIFTGYEDDIYLLVKLGQAALIIFMIFAIVSILFMLLNCCLAVTKTKQKTVTTTPHPLVLPYKQVKRKDEYNIPESSFLCKGQRSSEGNTESRVTTSHKGSDEHHIRVRKFDRLHDG